MAAVAPDSWSTVVGVVDDPATITLGGEDRNRPALYRPNRLAGGYSGFAFLVRVRGAFPTMKLRELQLTLDASLPPATPVPVGDLLLKTVATSVGRETTMIEPDFGVEPESGTLESIPPPSAPALAPVPASRPPSRPPAPPPAPDFSPPEPVAPERPPAPAGPESEDAPPDPASRPDLERHGFNPLQ